MNLTNKIGDGAQAEVYLSQGKAIKLFKPEYDKVQIFYEAMITSLVEQTGLPIAKVHEVLNVENQGAMSMDFIEGISLIDCLLKDTERTMFYIDKMVEIQIDIHSKMVQLPYTLKDRLKEKIIANTKISVMQKERVLKRLHELPDGNSLCHGDYHGYNILQHEHQYFIIDWIDATNGCEDGDVCRTYMLYCFYAPEIAQLYLDTYCKKQGKVKNEVLEWLPVIAAARLSENNVSEQEKILSWLQDI